VDANSPPTDPVLLNAWLATAPLHVAASWVFSARANKDRPELLRGPVFPEGSLRRLKSRNDAFLNLAIATSGDDDEVLKELWETGDHALRRAILLNPNRDARFRLRDELPGFMSPEAFKSFLNDAPAEDLEAFATHPTMHGDKLSAIFERKQLYAEMLDDRWHLISVQALMNPNLHAEPDLFAYDDGYHDYVEGKARSAALNALLSVPAAQPWAWALERGYEKLAGLDPPSGLPPEGISFNTDRAEFERWHTNSDKAFLESVFRRWTLDGEDEEGKRTITPEGSITLRITLASKVPEYRKQLHEWLITHPDKWVRLGASVAKRFSRPEEVREWYEREGWPFLLVSRDNITFHRRDNGSVVREIRDLLSKTEDAEKAGFTWEDARTIRRWWSNEAERLHNLDPKRFLHWNEDPIVSDGKRQPDAAPTAETVALLENRVSEMTARADTAQKPILEALAVMSQAMSASHQQLNARQEALARALEAERANTTRILWRLTVVIGIVAFIAWAVIRR
jgi:hypothetical protein